MNYRRLWIARTTLLAAVASLTLGGCSSITLRGVPAHRLPRWMLGEERATRQPINLIRLRQDPPDVYLLGPRDILGVSYPGVIEPEGAGQAGYVYHLGAGADPPSAGLSFPIRDDGTVQLPLLEPLKISGMTVTQAYDAIRDAYVAAGIGARTPQAADPNRLIVTLRAKRTYQVVVVREDLGSQQGAGLGTILAGPSKRGNAFSIDLKAYENDVMHALAETGGLPGLDAKNEVVILRGSFADAQSRDGIIQDMVNAGPYNGSEDMIRKNPNVVRIQLRAEPGQPLTQLTEDDIILSTGDIIFIESREREVYYTGGVLQGREIPLPRDYDLDVLAAISLAGGTVSSGITQGSLARTNNGVSGTGGGSSILPPTQIVVIRKLPNGREVPIKINLNRALVDPTQRILIQPGDYVMLQYTPLELAANIVLGSVSFQYFINRIQ